MFVISTWMYWQECKTLIVAVIDQLDWKFKGKPVGAQVVLTFSMQGVGNFVNTAVLCILMVIYKVARPNHHNKKYPYPPNRLPSQLNLVSRHSSHRLCLPGLRWGASN